MIEIFTRKASFWSQDKVLAISFNNSLLDASMDQKQGCIFTGKTFRYERDHQCLGKLDTSL